jgi:hypothetical protein
MRHESRLEFRRIQFQQVMQILPLKKFWLKGPFDEHS